MINIVASNTTLALDNLAKAIQNVAFRVIDSKWELIFAFVADVVYDWTIRDKTPISRA